MPDRRASLLAGFIANGYPQDNLERSSALEIRFNELRPVEVFERADGTIVTVMPLSRRHYRVTFLIGLAVLPCFVAVGLLVESFSVVFTAAWWSGLILFFCGWFWATRCYLTNPQAYGLEVDEFGIRERLLARNYFWSWSEIDTVEIQRIDRVNVIVLLLNKKSWMRKIKLQTWDVILSNEYAVQTPEILQYLLDQQKLAAIRNNRNPPKASPESR